MRKCDPSSLNPLTFIIKTELLTDKTIYLFGQTLCVIKILFCIDIYEICPNIVGCPTVICTLYNVNEYKYKATMYIIKQVATFLATLPTAYLMRKCSSCDRVVKSSYNGCVYSCHYQFHNKNLSTI